MREIKFRQPVFAYGKFHSWHYWGFIGDSFIGAIHDKGKTIAGDSQEYTGLHDKNGKEIYEGDILNIMPQYGYANDGVVVTWGDDTARWILKRVYNETGLYPSDWVKDCLIIGNQWDNPEPMEAK